MTAEFGKQFRAYRECAGLTHKGLSYGAYFSGGACHIERGKQNVSPLTIEPLAEFMHVPLHERALFFLRAAGFSEERIRIALGHSSNISVSDNSTQDGQIKAGAYLDMCMSRKNIKNDKLAEDSDVSLSAIGRLRHNKRIAKPSTAEKLALGLQIPPEEQAEFLLLVIGHRPEVVHQVLSALKGTQSQNGVLEEGEPLILQR